MTLRSKIIVALVVCELAIAGEAVVAIRGGEPASWSAQAADPWGAPSTRLVEGGPHQTFITGDHATLTVDIGYADLTIVSGTDPQIDVALNPTTSYGLFNTTSPITARRDGDTIRIATNARSWSSGDDRMVVVTVPPETHVTVLDAGNIKATGLRAEASIKSVGNGAVLVEDYQAPALHVESSSGAITLHQITADSLQVASDDGRLEGTGLHVRDGSVDVDGRVMLGFAPGTDTLVTAEASDGKINVSGFAVDASVSNGGKSDDDSHSETVRVGDAKGHLDVHSGDGNITLAKED